MFKASVKKERLLHNKWHLKLSALPQALCFRFWHLDFCASLRLEWNKWGDYDEIWLHLLL